MQNNRSTKWPCVPAPVLPLCFFLSLFLFSVTHDEDDDDDDADEGSTRSWLASAFTADWTQLSSLDSNWISREAWRNEGTAGAREYAVRQTEMVTGKCLVFMLRHELDCCCLTGQFANRNVPPRSMHHGCYCYKPLKIFLGLFSAFIDRDRVSVKGGEDGGNDMWQRTPGPGFEPASPRWLDYQSVAPTTRLWPGPHLCFKHWQVFLLFACWQIWMKLLQCTKKMWECVLWHIVPQWPLTQHRGQFYVGFRIIFPQNLWIIFTQNVCIIISQNVTAVYLLYLVSIFWNNV